MGQPFIVIGDQTDHGGEVVEGSPTSTTGGKSIARVGDKVTCPKHNHGPTTIVSGDETMLIDGKPAARHGDKCACGATLISSQVVSTAGGSGGAQGSAGVAPSASPSVPLLGTPPSWAQSSVADAGLPDDGNETVEEEVLEQHFELMDDQDQPVAGYHYDMYVNGESVSEAAR